jgi:ABC-2 type transport system ATP-binding protein
MDQAERLCKEIALIDGGRAVLSGDLGSIKQRFGANAVQMEFRGDGSFLKALPIVKRLDEYGQYVEIQLADGASHQELLRQSAARLEIRRFEIVTPRLHNIFVQLVGRESVDA